MPAEEAQQQQVGEGDGGVGQQKSQHHPQELVYSKPGCTIRETEQTCRVVAAAHTSQISEHGSGCRRNERCGPNDSCGHWRAARSAAEGRAGLESTGHITVPGQAHGCQEKAARKDVEASE